MGRGVFLGVVGAGVVGVLAGDRLTRAASPLGALVPDKLASFVPSGWRIYAVNPPWPEFDPAAYRLEVSGEVERPLSLTWDDVLALQRARQRSDFHCVTGWSVFGVRWEGVRLEQLWELARPTGKARHVRFVSMESPYVDTLAFPQTTMPDVMLAHTMDGKPLARAHGAPIRLVIPQMYGYKSVKWLTKIELVADPEYGFWEQRGYDVNAWVGRSNGY